MSHRLDTAAGSVLPACVSHPDNFDRPDVVLVQAPAWGVEMPSYALACLTGFARDRGFKVLPLDLNIACYRRRTAEDADAWEQSTAHAFWSTPETARAYVERNQDFFDRVVELIVSSGTPLVGFSVQYSSLCVSLKIARLLRARAPAIRIVLGGPQAARYLGGEQVLATGVVDALCTGEGEETLIELIERARAGHALVGTPGTLALRDGSLHDGPARPMLRRLDELPFADFDDYDVDAYTKPDVLPLATSRGCVNRCSFCSEVAYWTRYRGFSGQRIFDEVRYQVERRPQFKEIAFQDSLINGHLKEITRFGELLVEAGLDVAWSGQAIMRKDLSYTQLEKMKNSGCSYLSFGLESGSTAVLVGVGKNAMRGADADQIARDAHAVGLKCSYNFMFGLPGETRQEFEQSLDFIRRNKDNVYNVNPSTGLCAFPPGTEGYEHPERFGIVDVESVHYWESKDGTNTFPERLRRFEEFVSLAHELGVPCSYPWSTMKGRERKLAAYYMYKQQWDEALLWLERALEQSPGAEDLIADIERCKAERGAGPPVRAVAEPAKAQHRSLPVVAN